MKARVIRPGPSWWAHRRTRPPWVTVPFSASGVQPSVRERRTGGRSIRSLFWCVGVGVFCGGCASVRARCAACAGERRRAQRREANRAYGHSPLGRASGRERQARFRARRRARVTDAISTQTSASSMSSLPSTSEVEASVTEEIPFMPPILHHRVSRRACPWRSCAARAAVAHSQAECDRASAVPSAVAVVRGCPFSCAPHEVMS